MTAVRKTHTAKEMNVFLVMNVGAVASESVDWCSVIKCPPNNREVAELMQ